MNRIHVTSLLATALLVGCGAQVPLELRASSVKLTLPSLSHELHQTSEEGKVRVQLSESTSLSMQAVPSSAENVQRHHAEVAANIVLRFALGERRGELSQNGCRVFERQATCLTGWSEVDGKRVARNGVVFEEGSEVVWLEVQSPDAGEATRALNDVKTKGRIG